MSNTPKKLLNKEAFISKIDKLPMVIKGSCKFSDNFFKNDKHKTLFYGTGLSTTTKLSEGLPFDFVRFMAGAVSVARACNYKNIIHLIGDTHAKSNSFA
jgi:hypothetical protein